MSGGHFNYDQYRIGQIADEIEHLIETNNIEETDSFGFKIGRFYPQEIISKFEDAVLTLRMGEAMAQHIDWLVSGGDGEDNFRQRWDEELAKITGTKNKLLIQKREQSEGQPGCT